MRNFFLFFTILLLPVSSSTQNAPANHAYWQQSVRYQIEATLDTAAHNLAGHVAIAYKNNSPDTLKRIYLQVPANAFFDEANTAVREMRRFQSDNVRILHEADFPLTIQSVQFHAVGRESEFPLRAFNFHDTILDLPLPAVLLPGDSLVMSVGYTQDLKRAFTDSTSDDRPRRRRRSKLSSGNLQLEFVHWFPRVAVYGPAKRGWNAEPFHFLMNAESVTSEFAAIDVALTVPGNYVVVSSGEVIAGDPGWATVTADTAMKREKFKAWQDSVRQQLRQAAPRQLRFRAAPAQNFIWSISPAFVRATATTIYPVNIFYRGLEQQAFAKKVAQEIDAVLRYMRDRVGAYPFSELNVVAASRRDLSQPAMILLDDGDAFNLVFTLGRLYFPGIAGSNGVRESWMANGLAVFFGKDFSERRHGKLGYNADSARKDMGVFAKLYPLPSIDGLLRNFSRLYMNSGMNEPIANSIHQYKDPPGMFFNSYMKAELLYEMLRYVVGDSAFTQILRRYYNEWQFKHADEAAFVEICERTSGQDLDWFFNQWLHRTPTVDYQKGEVVKKQQPDGTWRTEVEIKRKGDGIMPVEVELERSDGSKIAQRWDGKSESGKVAFETAEKPGRVVVDPNDQIMDNNLLNNGRRRLEFKPDLPFMRFVHMPGDAYLVLWRPEIGYNSVDGLRLGARTRTSYRAFYHNLTLQLEYGFLSQTVDGTMAYSQPLRRSNVGNRYTLIARKNEGRFEAEANVRWQSWRSVASSNGKVWQAGMNFSRLLDAAYTFHKLANDTGKVKLQEWEDKKILLAYLQAEAHFGQRRFSGAALWRAEAALPQSEARFSKISGRVALDYRLPGLRTRLQGNFGTSFGPDRLPRQDVFHGEGADARTRFRNDIVKTLDDWNPGAHRLVEGGGNLRGYTGTPLLAERYATFNFELTPSIKIAGLSPFLFYDGGAIWPTRDANSLARANAGAALSFGGSQSRLFGATLFSNLAFRVYFPLWLSHPLPGEKPRQFRWYFALGKSL
jgi:hypothetical protein